MCISSRSRIVSAEERVSDSRDLGLTLHSIIYWSLNLFLFLKIVPILPFQAYCKF